jgi:hypothetical protein
MTDALRPDICMREAVTEAAAAVVRLPQVLRDIETAAARLATDDGRTPDAGAGRGGFGQPLAWLAWGLLALAVLALFLD